MLRRQSSASTTDEDHVVKGPKQRWADLSEEAAEAATSKPSRCKRLQDSVSTTDEDFQMESPHRGGSELSEESDEAGAAEAAAVEVCPSTSMREAEIDFWQTPATDGTCQEVLRYFSDLPGDRKGAKMQDAAKQAVHEHTAQCAQQRRLPCVGNEVYEAWGGIAYERWRKLHSAEWSEPLSHNEVYEEWGGIAYDTWCKLYWSECAEEKAALQIGKEKYDDWGGIAYDRWRNLYEQRKVEPPGKKEHPVSCGAAGVCREYKYAQPANSFFVCPVMPPTWHNQGSASQSCQSEVRQMAAGGEVHTVTLTGIPHSLRNQACLDAVLEASGVAGSILEWHAEQNGCVVVINFDSLQAATHCCNHFQSCTWSSGKLRVSVATSSSSQWEACGSMPAEP